MVEVVQEPFPHRHSREESVQLANSPLNNDDERSRSNHNIPEPDLEVCKALNKHHKDHCLPTDNSMF